MKGHAITIVVLLLALACYVADLTGPGLLLFFVGAALEIVFWLDAVQPSRRSAARALARIVPRR
ncbi:MAG: hypothetical protein JSW31_13535 [Burkholderiales bacterium]|jgi:hypothetical protein|nr:MAG: hypothetical protein JSW31_13535 [Burkholderiales bacterium]